MPKLDMPGYVWQSTNKIIDYSPAPLDHCIAPRYLPSGIQMILRSIRYEMPLIKMMCYGSDIGLSWVKDNYLKLNTKVVSFLPSFYSVLHEREENPADIYIYPTPFERTTYGLYLLIWPISLDGEGHRPEPMPVEYYKWDDEKIPYLNQYEEE